MLSALQLLAGVASVVCKLLEYPLPAKLWGTPGAQQGGGIPKDQLGLHPHPASPGAPAMFSCCTRTRSKCCLLFLPEAKLLLYFLELLIVNLRVLREKPNIFLL